jgi:CBS domain containing-hemolysin-like protein
LPRALGVAALILLNAFFVAGEYALVTARRTRIKELADQGNGAPAPSANRRDPPRFIAAMQLGVTPTSLGIGAWASRQLCARARPGGRDRARVVIAF